jgi:hypothetical protein
MRECLVNNSFMGLEECDMSDDLALGIIPYPENFTGQILQLN